LSARQARQLGATLVTLALVAACARAPAPTTTWQRPDVSPESTREVELDCHQRAIEAIAAAVHAADVEHVHEEREQYFQRCMRGSGFELR
jgi:hypothetical protein